MTRQVITTINGSVFSRISRCDCDGVKAQTVLTPTLPSIVVNFVQKKKKKYCSELNYLFFLFFIYENGAKLNRTKLQENRMETTTEAEPRK